MKNLKGLFQCQETPYESGRRLAFLARWNAGMNGFLSYHDRQVVISLAHEN